MTEQTTPTDAALTGQPPQANASTLIHDGAGAYLLHLRDDIPGIWEPGAWSLLGGGRDPGDRSLEETARRELREEAGLELPDLTPFSVEQARGSDGRTVTIQIFARAWGPPPMWRPRTPTRPTSPARPQQRAPSGRVAVRAGGSDSPSPAPPTVPAPATAHTANDCRAAR
ncbi:NUDIX domain-containing protein [Streptomyces angustmyceticus]